MELSDERPDPDVERRWGPISWSSSSLLSPLASVADRRWGGPLTRLPAPRPMALLLLLPVGPLLPSLWWWWDRAPARREVEPDAETPAPAVDSSDDEEPTTREPASRASL